MDVYLPSHFMDRCSSGCVFIPILLSQAATSQLSALTLRSERSTSTGSGSSCRSGTQRGRRDSEPSHQRNKLWTKPGFLSRTFSLVCHSGHSVSSPPLSHQVLQKHPRCHYCLRRDESRVVCECKAVVK